MNFHCFSCDSEVPPHEVIWAHDAPLCRPCFIDFYGGGPDESTADEVGQCSVCGEKMTPTKLIITYNGELFCSAECVNFFRTRGRDDTGTTPKIRDTKASDADAPVVGIVR